MASSYEDDDIKVAFEFRIVDSRGAVILWSSSIIAPDGYLTIGDAIQHQDDIQVNARDRFMQYWKLRDEDDSGTRILLRKNTGLHVLDGDVFERRLEEFVSEGQKRRVGIRGELVLTTTLDEVPIYNDWYVDGNEYRKRVKENKAMNKKKEKPPGDAFSVLLGAQKAIQKTKSMTEKTGLPEKRGETHGKDQLYNALIEYCLEHKIYLNTRLPKAKRNAYWRLLLTTLWKFNELGLAESAWKVKPPEDLGIFLGYSWHYTSQRSKRKRPDLSLDILNEMISLVNELQASQWLAPGRGGRMSGFVDGIQRTLRAERDAQTDHVVE